MMPGSPRFLDLVQVWCLAFEILTRTAIEMPAAFAREAQAEPPTIISAATIVGPKINAAYLSPAEREFLEGSHAGRH